MPLEESLQRLEGKLIPISGKELVALDEAVGRVLATDLVAPMSVPPHDNSAVDGWSIYFDDLNPDKETALPIGGRAPAGRPLERPQSRGEAIRIFTGAPMPKGKTGTNPDTVMMQEDCRVEGDTVIIPPGIKRGANSRFKGEDVAEGSTILTAGTRLNAPEIGLVASLGLQSVEVRQKLKVAIFSTGDEILEPGTPLPAGAVYDSNRYTVKALLRKLGAEVTDLGILQDDSDTISEALLKATETHDVIMTSGGVSTGEEDHVRSAVEKYGRLDAWRIAIKPGRPAALGVLNKRAFIGLPGNPVAVVVTFLFLARPILLSLMGATADELQRFPVKAGFDYKKKTGRREYVRVALSTDAGTLIAHKAGREGAGILSSLVAADGLLEIRDDITSLSKGDLVDYLPLKEVMG